MQLGPMLRREGHISQHIGLGLVRKPASLGSLGRSWSALRSCRLGIVLGKRGGDEGGDDAPPALGGMRQYVAHEVEAAALPGRQADRRQSAYRFRLRSDDGPVLGAAVGAREQCILPVERNRADRALDGVVVELDAALIDEARQPLPA